MYILFLKLEPIFKEYKDNIIKSELGKHIIINRNKYSILIFDEKQPFSDNIITPEIVKKISDVYISLLKEFANFDKGKVVETGNSFTYYKVYLGNI